MALSMLNPHPVLRPVRSVARIRKAEARAQIREENMQKKLSFAKMKNFVESINATCYIINNAKADPNGNVIPTPPPGVYAKASDIKSPVQMAAELASNLVLKSETNILNGSIHPYAVIEGKKRRLDLMEYFEELEKKWYGVHELFGASALGLSMLSGLLFGEGGLIGRLISSTFTFIGGFALYWAYTLPIQKAVQSHYVKKEAELHKKWELVCEWAGKHQASDKEKTLKSD